MRIGHLALVAFAFAALAACSPYSPTLPAEPFLCGSADPKCPDGYTCGGMNGSGQPVCVVKTTATVDAPSLNGMCADDSMVEMANGHTNNDTIATAFALPSPLTPNPFVLTQLAVCPKSDKDNYSLVINANQEIKADVQYDSWGSALQGALLNSAGTPIKTMAAVSGQTNVIEADVASLPAGMYYIQVFGPASDPGINNYKLTVTVM